MGAFVRDGVRVGINFGSDVYRAIRAAYNMEKLGMDYVMVTPKSATEDVHGYFPIKGDSSMFDEKKLVEKILKGVGEPSSYSVESVKKLLIFYLPASRLPRRSR
jgi:hypothetical protein